MTDPKQQLKDLADHATRITKIEGQKGIPDDLFNVTPQTQTGQTANPSGQTGNTNKAAGPGK
jgi:hypothetical protein